MTTRTETRQFRLAQWRKVFEAKAASGLNAKDFCASNGISKDSYYYWQSLVRQEALSQIKQPTLVELKPPAKINNSESMIDKLSPADFKPQIIVTVNKATVQADVNTPKELLKMVLEALSDAE